MTIREARAKAAEELSSLGSGQLDADVLLKWILCVDETYLLFYRDTQLTERQEASFWSAIAERKRGREICYITGHKEFYGLDFILSRHVLPPKPDTELLVDNTIDLVQQRIAMLSKLDQVLLCDLCCGCGCVGISVMHTLRQRLGCVPPVQLILIDISDKAILIAQENARRLLDSETQRLLCFIQSDMFARHATRKEYDVIAANPPYVSFLQASSLLSDGRDEPMVALCGDEPDRGGTRKGDGLDVTRRLIRTATRRLAQGGALVLETGEYQVSEVEKLMVKAHFRHVEVSHDLAGKPRNVQGRLWKKATR